MSAEFSADFWTELSAEFAIYFTADLKRICDGRHGGFYGGFYSGFDGANVSEIRFPSDVRGHFHDGFYVRINFAPPTIGTSSANHITLRDLLLHAAINS